MLIAVGSPCGIAIKETVGTIHWQRGTEEGGLQWFLVQILSMNYLHMINQFQTDSYVDCKKKK